MSERIKQNFTPPTDSDFQRYERPDTKIIPIKTDRLDLSFLIGEERAALLTSTTGYASLVLRYKGREGAVSSITTPKEEIQIVQLQGAAQEGYRVNTSLDWTALMADQILAIAQDPRNEVRRLTMPFIGAILGAIDAEESALKRYGDLATRIGMSESESERAWIRDINP